MKRKNLFFMAIILLFGLIIVMAGSTALRNEAVAASVEASATIITLTSAPSMTESATSETPISTPSNTASATNTPTSTATLTSIPSFTAPAASETPISTRSNTASAIATLTSTSTATAMLTNTPSSPSTLPLAESSPDEVLTGESLTNAFEELFIGNPEPAKALSCEADHKNIDAAAEALAVLSDEAGVDVLVSCEVSDNEASCELTIMVDFEGQEPIEDSTTIVPKIVEGKLCGEFE